MATQDSTSLDSVNRQESRLSDDDLPLVVFLVYREVLASVFSSQVLVPLSQLTDQFNIRIVAHVPAGHFVRLKYRAAMRAVREKAMNLGLKTSWLPSPPTRLNSLWSDHWILKRFLAKSFCDSQPFILHCRNALMTSIALEAVKSLPQARVVYDMRGDNVAESGDLLGLSDRSRTSPHEVIQHAWQRQQQAATESDAVIVVSRQMRQLLSERFGADVSSEVQVVPCCPDSARFREAVNKRQTVRQQHNLANRFLVTYLGSMAWYQMPQHAIRIFRLIHQINPAAHFLAITTSPMAMRAELEQAGVGQADFSILSVTADEVPELLCAADVGLLLRKSDDVNRVAAPIKFGEYLAAGVPVIISEGIGDYSSDVATESLGVVVNMAGPDRDLIEQLTPVVGPPSESIRERCWTYADRNLDWRLYLEERAALYRRLLGPSS